MKALTETIKFEFKKHFKLMVCSVSLVYLLKYLLYLIHAENYSKPVGDAMVLMFFIGSAVTVYLGASSISSEREKNTLAFLFTRQSDRRHIITGKIASTLMLVSLFLLFTIPALTPSPTIEIDWIMRAFDFAYNESLSLIGIISMLLALPLLWSSFSKTTSGSYIFSIIASCISAFFIIKFISFEVLWQTQIFLLLTVCIIINQTLGRGEILPEKAVLKKNIRLLLWALPIYLIFLFCCSLFFDAFYIANSSSPVQAIMARPFGDVLVTNRVNETQSQFTPYRNQNTLSTDIHKDLKNQKNCDLSKRDWQNILKRNQTALSVSPDGTKLLYTDKRNFFGMKNIEKPHQLCIKTKTGTLDLGLTKGYSPSFTWLEDNSLVYWLSRYNHKESRKHNTSIHSNTLKLMKPNGQIKTLLEIASYYVGKTYSLNSGSHIIIPIKKIDKKKNISIIEISTGKILEIERSSKSKLNDLNILSTHGKRILAQLGGKKIILDLSKILKMKFDQKLSEEVSMDFNKFVKSEEIDGFFQNVRLNKKGWIAFYQQNLNDKNDTLLKIKIKIGDKFISKEYTIKGYTALRTCWNNDNNGFAALMITSEENNRHNKEYNEIINSKDYALAPFFYTNLIWLDSSKKLTPKCLIKVFTLNNSSNNVIEKDISKKSITLYDYYNTSFTWITDKILAASFDNKVELINIK